jgi:dimethylargininase
MSYTRAIVRRPTPNFASGLSSANEGPPDFAHALQQHEDYCAALRNCGLRLTYLEPDSAYPDGTFVEDTAVATDRGAVITRPGAPSRSGEVDTVAANLSEHYPDLKHISAPGTVDGGDVCEADDHFVIGVSARTNEAGAKQLARHLQRMGYTTSIVDIRSVQALLHLKTGIAYLGDGIWVVRAEILAAVQSWGALRMRAAIAVSGAEAYAANCVRVNDAVLVARGYPRLAEAVRDAGFAAVPLQMSEFRKMDGGLSCLSIRF